MAEEVETASPASQSQSQSQSQSHPSPSSDKPAFKQVLGFTGFNTFHSGNVQMFSVMYPTPVPSLVDPQTQEQTNRGAGLYAVPVAPFMGPTSGFQPNTLIPLTYSVPTRQSNEARTTGEGSGQGGQQQQQAGQQRQVVVRRFQIAIHLDLLLIIKLAAVIFLFHQDGSRQRLAVLVFFASLVYLYQTGALAPLVRWLSQGMHRAAAPPQPPRPAVRAENMPAAEGQGNENVPLPAEGHMGAEDENRAAGDGNHGVQNENAAEPGAGNGANRWWGIVKEIQMIVFGFISSLLPGFHNID